ncbi:MAG: MATE family efflux transporter, partial [Muribaculaceae bacterium]|nr:MATE family efflux transporter [Muribaculaceae bacterium]
PAQASGRGDMEEEATVLWRGLLLAGALGAAIIALSGSAAAAALRFLDADGATASHAQRYFSIAVWGAPAVLGSYVLTGWFLGMQNSRAPMWMALWTNVVNIAVSVGLVAGAGWKLEGVATGTLTAQWAGVALGFALLRRYRPRAVALRRLVRGAGLRRYFSVNADIFLRTLCLVAVTVWFTRSGAQAGVVTLAANALLMQLFMLFSFFMDGFAYAGEAIGGRCYGAADRKGLDEVAGKLLRLGAGLALLFGTAYMAGGRLILELLTDRREVVDAAAVYLPWAAAVPLAGVWAFVWDGIFIGMTRTRAMLAAMAAAMVVFFAAWALTRALGNHGLWLAFVLYLATRGAVEWALYCSNKPGRRR